MEYTISKIEAATDQLDWAIRLHLDHKAYVPAITLAGAAEEIIGEILADGSAFQRIKSTLAARTGLSEKAVSQEYLNRAKNWLKHWKDLRDADTLVIDLEGEATQYIVRALVNFVLHDQSLPSEGPRFFKWLRQQRPDLLVMKG